MLASIISKIVNSLLDYHKHKCHVATVLERIKLASVGIFRISKGFSVFSVFISEGMIHLSRYF